MGDYGTTGLRDYGLDDRTQGQLIVLLSFRPNRSVVP